MHKLFYCIIGLLASLAVLSQNVIDEVVWIVGDDAILKSDIENQRLRMIAEGERIEGDPYCKIPELMAINKLFLNQAKIDSIYASDIAVASEVNQRMNFFLAQIGTKEKVEEYFGKKMNELKDEMTEIVREQMIIQQMQQKLIGGTTVSPAEVRDFYEKLPKDSLPTIPVQVELQVITKQPAVTLAEKEKIKKQLRDYKQRIEDGSDFSVLALLYSEDKLSAEKGGELGFIPRSQLVKEYANVAWSLSDTETVSRVVESEFGFHIIQLIEKRGDLINTRHILLSPKVSFENKNMAVEQLDSIADRIREGKIPFEEAVLLYSDNKETKMNKGQLVNLKTGTFKFEFEQLPSQMAKVAYNMNVGEISSPFYYTNDQGKEVAAVIKLKSKTKSHPANMSDDYQLLKNMVLTQKNQKIMTEWIKERQKDTYVKIDERWQNCDFDYEGWVK